MSKGGSILDMAKGAFAARGTKVDPDESLDTLRQRFMAAQGARDAMREKMVRTARLDINAFIETVMKDELGNRLRQERLHETWWEAIAYARAHDRHLGIVAPFGMGKSVQMQGGSAYIIGNWPEVRIAAICNAFNLAKDTVSAVRRIIDFDADYREIFPGIVAVDEKHRGRRRKEEWAGSKFRVRSRSLARDATMQAFGVMSVGAGRRLDVVLLDDPLDFTNTIEKPAMRPKVLDSIQTTWTGRLSEWGMIICITTVYHTDDAVAHLQKNDAWCWLVQSVNEDQSAIQSRIIMPGWPEHDLPDLPTPGNISEIMEREEASYRKQGADLDPPPSSM